MKLRRVVWIVIIIASVVVCLGGCASSPYAEIGVGYQVQGTQFISGGNCINCGNPKAHIAIGLEWDRGVRCEWQHHSQYLQGVPFNEDPEYSHDLIQCVKRWGGK